MARQSTKKAKHTYQTPNWFLDLVRAVAPIDLDPCGSAINNTDATIFCYPGTTYQQVGFWMGEDGLKENWAFLINKGLAFVNSEYGRSLPIWTDKIIEESVPCIVLVPARTDVKWFKKLHGWCSHRVDWSSSQYGSRLSFIDPDTGLPVKGNDHASTVFFFHPNPATKEHKVMAQRFVEVFSPHGTLIK